jgi:hypothetical protein
VRMIPPKKKTNWTRAYTILSLDAAGTGILVAEIRRRPVGHVLPVARRVVVLRRNDRRPADGTAVPAAGVRLVRRGVALRRAQVLHPGVGRVAPLAVANDGDGLPHSGLDPPLERRRVGRPRHTNTSPVSGDAHTLSTPARIASSRFNLDRPGRE